MERKKKRWRGVARRRVKTRKMKIRSEKALRISQRIFVLSQTHSCFCTLLLRNPKEPLHAPPYQLKIPSEAICKSCLQRELSFRIFYILCTFCVSFFLFPFFWPEIDSLGKAWRQHALCHVLMKERQRVQFKKHHQLPQTKHARDNFIGISETRNGHYYLFMYSD